MIDADVRRADGEPGGDRFRELFPAVDFRVPLSRESYVVNSGGHHDATVRVRGEDGFTETMGFLDVLGRKILGLKFVTDYTISPGQSYVKVRTEVHNPTNETITGLLTGDFLSMGDSDNLFTTAVGFEEPAPFTRTRIAASRADRVSYAWVVPGDRFTIAVATEPGVGLLSEHPLVIPPGGTEAFERYLVVGRTLASVMDIAMTLWGMETRTLTGRVIDPDGKPVANAEITLRATENNGQAINQTLTTSDGHFKMTAPLAVYDLWVDAEGHRRRLIADTDLRKDANVQIKVGASASIRLHFDGPVKITAEPVSGNISKKAEPAEHSAATLVRYSNTGAGTLPLAPGHWRITASRGMDFELQTRSLELVPGATFAFGGTLKRAIQATEHGWLAADFHQHTVGSPDGEPTVRQKLIHNIAEGCQVAVITDHDRVSNVDPHTAGLGAPLLAIDGVEASPTPEGHVNAFPVTRALEDGSRLWAEGGVRGLLARFAADPTRPLVVINHPRDPGMGVFQFKRTDPFQPKAPGQFDALEVNDAIGELTDYFPSADPRIRELAIAGARTPAMIDWFAWLNTGKPVVGVGVSDSHKSHEGTCHSRTYVWTGTAVADTSAQDVVTALRAQRAVVSRGLFLDVKANGGRHIGHTDVLTPTGSAQPVQLSIKLEAPTWVTTDNLSIFERGRPVRLISTRRGWRQARKGEAGGVFEIPTTREGKDTVAFDSTINLTPNRDTWYVVVARGEGTGAPVFTGAPFAYTNPIYVDMDGDGIAGHPAATGSQLSAR